MLSFPAQNWEKAASAMKASSAPRNSGLGRVASIITPRLYISDYFTATDVERLKAHGITHVISVVESPPVLPDMISPDHRLNVPLADKPEADILQHLDHTTAWIAAAFEENKTNKVLVHCMQGISRSATVVCAYLVATTDMSAVESIAYVQAIRGIVCPNSGFRRQLEEYSIQYMGRKSQTSSMTTESKSSGGIKFISSRIKLFRGFSVGKD